ncbi:TMV resistance protein N [Morella rubra]|uniref:ADP-ribosyl cyclase/cyclic ADP-ribose hydrolase n=1 Tax=Morella rubra TaxID=262757 RepID=A0A6A1W9H4_9ROSI|nr:TMV resistance protein N [Morella rubra]
MATTSKIQKGPSPVSSSCSETHVKFDVFLNFRGEDTRDNFTDHLYHSLVDNGIHTFKDAHKLDAGTDMKQNLLDAIRKSKMALVIFSKDYASSTWCLEELTEIFKCMKERGMKIWPIFYHVQPSDVRQQKGTFGEPFVKHSKNFKEKVDKWKFALKQVASLSGSHLKDGSESQFIKSLVGKISRELIDYTTPVPSTTPGLSSSQSTIDALEKKIEQLKQELLQKNQEVVELRTQVASLCKRCKSQDRELQKSANELQEIMAQAAKNYAKLKAAKKVIQLLSEKMLKDMSGRLPSGEENVTNVADKMAFITIHTHRESTLLCWCSDEVRQEYWREQYVPGVYVTLEVLGDGTTKLRRLQFSPNVFDEHQANTWMSKNLEELRELYNVRWDSDSIQTASFQICADGGLG